MWSLTEKKHIFQFFSAMGQFFQNFILEKWVWPAFLVVTLAVFKNAYIE